MRYPLLVVLPDDIRCIGEFPVQYLVIHYSVEMQAAFAGHPLHGHIDRLRNFYSFFINMAVRHLPMFAN